MEYTKMYKQLHPVLKKKLRRRKLVCLLWAMMGTLLFLFGGWFFAIVPFVILVTDFIFKNNFNKKGLTLVKAKVTNKVAEAKPAHHHFYQYTHTHEEGGVQHCQGKYCFELDIYEAHFFSCFGKMANNKSMTGKKMIAVEEPVYSKFEQDTDVTLILLFNKRCVGYLINGELMVA